MLRLGAGRRDRLALRIRVYGLLGVLATIAGFLGRWHWFLDLFSHFRVQYFFGLGVFCLLLLALRSWKLAAGFAAVALLNGALLLPFYFPPAPAAMSEDPPLRALLSNVNTSTGDPERVAAAIASYDTDIVVLLEVNLRWLEALAPALEAYPHRESAPREDNFGIALYSKHPFSEVRVRSATEAQVPFIVAELDTGSGLVTVIAVHTLPPLGGAYSRMRNEQLAQLPRWVREAQSPVLLLGDLNTTPWNHHFKRLLQQSGLCNASLGRGLQATWPTHLFPLRISIDHCLHAPEISIVNKEVGPGVGSDHFPLIVDFLLPPPAP